MKKFYLLVILNISILFLVKAQSPEAIKYQAIARDEQGNALTNHSISVQVSIYQNSTEVPPVYAETFPATTNDFGQFTLNIGMGAVLAGTFAEIDWSKGTYFLQIAIDKNAGTSYQLMGTSQLLSVPYSLQSKKASGLTDTVTLPWAYKFQIYEKSFTEGYKRKTFLSQGWDGIFGDFVYFGSTGNRLNTKQSAMIMSQDQGFLFGKGNEFSTPFLSKFHMHLDTNGRLSIGSELPTERLTIVNGNLNFTASEKGIMLNADDKPMITRGYDPFSSGAYQGLGRWGLFKEAMSIVVGMPKLAGEYIKFCSYNENSTIADNLMTINQAGDVNIMGNFNMNNSSKGILLDGQNRPMITRYWDPFTSGNYQGVGRWGLFMEYFNLTLGVPALSNRGIKFCTYNENSTIASELMTISQTGNVSVAGTLTAANYSYATPQTYTYSVSGQDFRPITNTTIITGGGNGGAYQSTAGSGVIQAPIHLPDGATITGCRIYFYNNNSAKAANLSVSLSLENLNIGGYSTVSLSVNPSTVSGYGYVNSSINSGLSVVNNAIYGYMIWAYSSDWDTTGNLKVKGAVITYTMAKP